MQDVQLCAHFERAIQILERRWNGLVLSQLLQKNYTFSQLEILLPINGTLLKDRLHELENEGLVVQVPSSSSPSLFHYSLTKKGKELEPVMNEIRKWASKYA